MLGASIETQLLFLLSLSLLFLLKNSWQQYYKNVNSVNKYQYPRIVGGSRYVCYSCCQRYEPILQVIGISQGWVNS